MAERQRYVLRLVGEIDHNDEDLRVFPAPVDDDLLAEIHYFRFGLRSRPAQSCMRHAQRTQVPIQARQRQHTWTSRQLLWRVEIFPMQSSGAAHSALTV